jgi:hypothetical protein
MQSIIEYPENSNELEINENHNDSHNKGFVNHDDTPLSKSLAIPLPKYHIHRTASELDLSENIAIAEYRDQCMFNRLVTGIRKQQTFLYNGGTHPHQQQPQRQKEQHQHQHKHQHKQPHCQQQQTFHDETDTNTNTNQCEIINEEISSSYADEHDSHLRSTSPEYLEENERSIENIISTRREYIYSDLSPQTPRRTLSMTFIVTDDEDSNFGQVFDLDF